ncbi:aminoglycoside phosphotransferase family protein [Nocardia sp. NPDC003963]
MTVPLIPDRLDRAIIFLRGEQEGRAWLDALPERLAGYADCWSLSLESIADTGAMSCCAYCTTPDGTAAVLKIPVDQQSGYTEIQLLQRWSASGAAPAILARDNESGVFLMTRILPGSIAWPVGDGGDTDRFGRLLTELNAPGLPEPPGLKDLSDVVYMRMGWARDRFADPRYAEAMQRFSAPDRLAEAEALADVLLRTTTVQHVLHADLQAKNILQGPTTWHTIDPLGAMGDINCEAALWVAIQDGPATIADRLGELATHPLLDTARLHAWTYVLTVAEYRSYLPTSAGRMEDFAAATDADRLRGSIE